MPMLFESFETPAGPDAEGKVHLMLNKRVAFCGAELTGDVVPEDCPLDCTMCHEEHPHNE